MFEKKFFYLPICRFLANHLPLRQILIKTERSPRSATNPSKKRTSWRQARFSATDLRNVTKAQKLDAFTRNGRECFLIRALPNRFAVTYHLFFVGEMMNHS
ncbi:hypothetical protein CEXT_108781 [Caerostris extrusa]|uniref:Uncharacterized protein n=1 Tax=Caerostris extrusa TaxID=172846 RepID=A0AAV4PC59_CAEEX|nr:hypothetical protein CEXT_108781 [Caerostris extrusa]